MPRRQDSDVIIHHSRYVSDEDADRAKAAEVRETRHARHADRRDGRDPEAAHRASEQAKRDQEQEGKASQEKQLLDIMMAKFKKDFPDAVTEQSKEV